MKKYIDKTTILAITFYLSISMFLLNLVNHDTSNRKMVEIYQSGELIYRHTLEGELEFTLKQLGENVVFQIKNGKIRIKQNDCPKKICVHMGWIDKPYESIICVPKKIVVRIRAGSNKNKRIQVTTG